MGEMERGRPEAVSHCLRGWPGRDIWERGGPGAGARGELPGWLGGGGSARCLSSGEGMAAGEASFAIRRRRGGRDGASPGPQRQRLLLPGPDPARAGPASPHAAQSARASGWPRRPRGPQPGARCPAGQARGREDAGSELESRGGRARSGPGRARGSRACAGCWWRPLGGRRGQGCWGKRPAVGRAVEVGGSCFLVVSFKTKSSVSVRAVR